MICSVQKSWNKPGNEIVDESAYGSASGTRPAMCFSTLVVRIDTATEGDEIVVYVAGRLGGNEVTE